MHTYVVTYLIEDDSGRLSARNIEVQAISKQEAKFTANLEIDASGILEHLQTFGPYDKADPFAGYHGPSAISDDEKALQTFVVAIPGDFCTYCDSDYADLVNFCAKCNPDGYGEDEHDH